MKSFRLLVALLLVTLPLRYAAAEELWKTLPPTPTPVAGGHADRTEINGIRLYHVEVGAGPPVVLLHGGLANSDYLADQARVLAQAHRVILVDSRGHGRSTRDQRPFGYDLMADDVIALLDNLKIDKAAIIGWSDGGITAPRHPDTGVGGGWRARRRHQARAHRIYCSHDSRRTAAVPRQRQPFCLHTGSRLVQRCDPAFPCRAIALQIDLTASS
ncbi:alpha/beta fold hydrolase [Bradyrhizobium sp. URHD0069]|uniref:alpha/beta fold hydrolase n=1 Tax=Bradyrhizobium sp. URHD0069 TaxID=1380355 RepID=UPI000A42D297|nr:alpha/beta fold hydrolase [Bradyrhizobium sp. URHD0069]